MKRKNCSTWLAVKHCGISPLNSTGENGLKSGWSHRSYTVSLWWTTTSVRFVGNEKLFSNVGSAAALCWMYVSTVFGLRNCELCVEPTPLDTPPFIPFWLLESLLCVRHGNATIIETKKDETKWQRTEEVNGCSLQYYYQCEMWEWAKPCIRYEMASEIYVKAKSITSRFHKMFEWVFLL